MTDTTFWYRADRDADNEELRKRPFAFVELCNKLHVVHKTTNPVPVPIMPPVPFMPRFDPLQPVLQSPTSLTNSINPFFPPDLRVPHVPNGPGVSSVAALYATKTSSYALTNT